MHIQSGETCLERGILAVCILVSSLGIIAMLYSNVTTETPIYEYEVLDEGASDVKAYFETGDRFDVYIAPGVDWDKHPFEPATTSIPYPFRFVGVDVTDPAGNTISLEYDFVLSGGRLSLYSITAEESSNASYVSVVNLKPLECKAETSGEYTAEIWGIVPNPQHPPGAFQLRKMQYVKVEVERPYSYLLPIGVVVFTFGIVISALSIFGPLKPKKKRLKRKLGSKSLITLLDKCLMRKLGGIKGIPCQENL